jgi:hypothetical protein
MKDNLTLLASIPLWEVNDVRLLTDDERLFVDRLPEEKNNGNFLTKNKQILDFPELADLKILMQSYVDHYTKNILQITNNFLITDSWSTKTPPNGYHHEHRHPNSIFSGIYYSEISGGLLELSVPRQFSKEFNFGYDYSGFDSVNSSQWQVPTAPGSLVIFPSWVNHMVKPNESRYNRRVIAFNTFVTGKLGNDHRLDNVTIG